MMGDTRTAPREDREMPWEVTSAMNERSRFIEAKLRGEHESMAELCRAFGVSRKTGYKWWERFEQGGTAAPSTLTRMDRGVLMRMNPLRR